MKTEEKALIKGKKIECWLGIFLLIPPILGVLSFVFCLCGKDGTFFDMSDLSPKWSMTTRDGGNATGAAMSAAPIYLALMAIAGAYLVKDNMKYLFMSKGETKDVTPKAESES